MKPKYALWLPLILLAASAFGAEHEYPMTVTVLNTITTTSPPATAALDIHCEKSGEDTNCVARPRTTGAMVTLIQIIQMPDGRIVSAICRDSLLGAMLTGAGVALGATGYSGCDLKQGPFLARYDRGVLHLKLRKSGDANKFKDVALDTAALGMSTEN